MGLLSLPIGIVRTLVGVLKRFVFRGKQPLRIDLPFPFIPFDVVLLSDPEHITALNYTSEVGHLHAIPTENLPKWTQWYFSGTHFHNQKRDKWFLALEPQTIAADYHERRAMHDTRISAGFTGEDVKRVAQLVQANANEDVVADACAQMVIGRLLIGKEVPQQMVKTGRTFLSANIADALVPFHYAKSKQAQETIYEYCAANVPEGTHPIDVVHAFGAVCNKFAHAITTLKDNLDTSVETLFTRAKNLPTPNTPRVFLTRTMGNGLLAYPSNPGQTIIILNNAKAAEATNSLFYTLGSGDPSFRVCAFKGYFINFMTALQKELTGTRPSTKLSNVD